MSLKSKATFVDQDKVKQLFEKYDFNKNGILEPDEFLNIMVDILKKLGEDLPEKKHREVAEEGLSRFDLNNNGTIEFNEFYEFINFLVSEKGYSLWMNDVIQFIFIGGCTNNIWKKTVFENI